MTPVTREQYHAFIRRYPERTSIITSICEPPQEQCFVGKTLIGYVVLSEPREPRTYWIDEGWEARSAD